MLTAAAIFGGTVTLVAAGGALFNPSRGATRAWYDALEKPSFTPPDAIFGPVWTLLYGMIAVSGARIWLKEPGPARTSALTAWFGQLMLNAAWSPLFFGARRPGLALVDITLMLVAIAVYIRQAHRVDKPAAWLMTPYVAWVSFATLLNAAIVQLNVDGAVER